MKALRNHFAGEGNASRNISVADRLHDSLHYKNERSMAFETFLTNSQKMFNIYDTENSPMDDAARVRFLFKRVQHSALQPAIEALKAQQTAGVNVTYSMAANHLSAAVSALPEYISRNRNISGLGAHDPNDKDGTQQGSTAVYNADGSINTGHIPNWQGLSKSDKDIVQAERKRLGIKFNPKSKGNQQSSANNVNRLKQLTQQNKKYRRQIKALKRGKSTNTDGDGDNDDDGDEDIDAGDQFGGKNGRRKQKLQK